jgi:hypothetical protein
VYEYQRWLPVRGWGTVLLPTDPGKWSDASQVAWGAALAEVAPPLPALGWAVAAAWAPVQDGAVPGDGTSWQYSSSGTGSTLSAMRSPTWALTSGGTRTVRRRLWRRTVTLVDTQAHNSPRAASTAPSAAGQADGTGTEAAGAATSEAGAEAAGQGAEAAATEASIGVENGGEAHTSLGSDRVEASPLCRMAVRVYAKLLFYCMDTQPNSAGGALDLLLAMEKQSANGPSVVSLLLSELIAEIHADLLARSLAGSAASSGTELEWVTAMRASPLWENLRELSHLVSVRAAKGGVALTGVPGAKRAVLQQRRIGEVKSRMTLEQLHRCHYKCSEDRHKNICYFTTDVCSQCHHALAAHELVPRPDPFKGLRRRLDDELAASMEPRDDVIPDDDVLSPHAANKNDGRSRGGGGEKEAQGVSSLLKFEFPLLGGHDRGAPFVVTTAAPEPLSVTARQHSAKWPLAPLAFDACGPERHLYLCLQLNHLVDLVLFPTDAHAESTAPAAAAVATAGPATEEGLLQRLSTVHGVGVGVGNLDAWTPAVPTLVLSALRANLALLSHLALADPQLPAVCLRLRRLVHYLVWVGDAEEADGSDDVSEADLWALGTLLHLRTKLVQIRVAVFGFPVLGADPMPEAFGAAANDTGARAAAAAAEAYPEVTAPPPPERPASDARGDATLQQLGFSPLQARVDKAHGTAAAPALRDLARAVFCHRAFPYAAWEEYGPEENAAIGAALAASPHAGRVALPGPETGTSYEARPAFLQGGAQVSRSQKAVGSLWGPFPAAPDFFEPASRAS